MGRNKPASSSSGGHSSPFASLSMRKAKEAAERNRFEKALDWLERADPNSAERGRLEAEIRYRWAAILISERRWTEAESNLNRCPRGSGIPNRLIDERLRLIRARHSSNRDLRALRERLGRECEKCSGGDLYEIATCSHQAGAAPPAAKLPSDLLKPQIDGVYAAAAYRPGWDPDRGSPLTTLIRMEKREMSQEVMRVLGAFFADFIGQHTPLPGSVDVVVPVPTSREREESRGGSLPHELACAVRDALALPLEEPIVQVAAHLDHTQARGEARRQGLRAAWKSTVPEWLHGRTVLLVDDILTTGTTVCTAAELLTAGGVAGVYVAAFQHTERSR